MHRTKFQAIMLVNSQKNTKLSLQFSRKIFNRSLLKVGFSDSSGFRNILNLVNPLRYIFRMCRAVEG